MKAPPAVSLAAPRVDALGLGCPAPLPVNDAAEPSYVGLRLGPSKQLPAAARTSSAGAQERARPGAVAGGHGAGPCADAPAEDPGDATDAADAQQAYQLWKGRVWRFASRLGIPNEALEDATQDVFTAVFRRWSDFQGLSTRRTWVLGFVPRVASSYRRRQRHRPQPAFDAEARGGVPEHQSNGSSESDPFESTARREATRIVRAFLEGLPEKDRQLFVLVDLEDASVVEAAAILNIATHRAYKILEKIRRALEATMVRHRAVDRRRLP